MATVWTFWACCSRTPQLIAGGRRPRPRKLSAVSLTIMAGSASVVAAMMWLMNDGTMCTKIDPHLAAADQPSRDDEVLLAEREEPPPHDAGQLGPAEERDDDRDREVDLQDRPLARQRGGEAHPQRDGRDRAEDLDGPLDHGVDDSAVEPGEPAQDHAQHEAHQHARRGRWSARCACRTSAGTRGRGPARRCREGRWSSTRPVRRRPRSGGAWSVRGRTAGTRSPRRRAGPGSSRRGPPGRRAGSSAGRGRP